MEGHFLIITGKICQEELSIFNIYARNIRATIFIKETLLKLKIYIAPHAMIVGELNTPTPTNGWIIETKIEQGRSETSRGYGPIDINRNLQNISS